jgi:serine/threonine-protein kinase HipA
MRSLITYLNKTKIGTLSESNDIWRFEYDSQWITAQDSFDLSPTLQRSKIKHQDGSNQRPVQWYFDNLLPEENLRDVMSKEANIQANDAFGLIEYLGAESAGSLILLPPNQQVSERGGLRELPDAELCKRIQNLPRATLSSGAPKRMSVAGAQNKLLVVYRDGKLYEPLDGEPSTHILKPNHESSDYPASVMNEYVVMSLALKLKLRVPPVYRKYTPEPIYIVERFDRYIDKKQITQRSHIIDACQLLNKSRAFKYKAATLDTLAEIVMLCRNRIETRLQLYLWLVFNLLIANNDNHLKNLSFMVSSEGIEISPAYDLLSTGAYHTKALADHRANWPEVSMAINLPGASTYSKVTRESVLNAGEILGLTRRICERELDRLVLALPIALDELIVKIEYENKQYPQSVKVYFAGELRLIRTIKYIVVPFMIERVKSKL